jgi:hypothetical protein
VRSKLLFSSFWRKYYVSVILHHLHRWCYSKNANSKNANIRQSTVRIIHIRTLVFP